MPTEEISSVDWGLFCRRFTEMHQGALMTLNVVNLDGRSEELARDFLFQKMTFQKTRGCNDLIRIELNEPGQREINHEILEPIHVKVRDSDNERKVLSIQAETGTTLLTFSSGRIGEVLQGLHLI